jgi:hypothetical protein
MVSEQEQMKTLQDKILDSTEVTALLGELEAFGRKSLPYMSEILTMSHNSDVIRSTNFCISRVKQQFVWPDA